MVFILKKTKVEERFLGDLSNPIDEKERVVKLAHYRLASNYLLISCSSAALATLSFDVPKSN